MHIKVQRLRLLLAISVACHGRPFELQAIYPNVMHAVMKQCKHVNTLQTCHITKHIHSDSVA